MVESIEKGTGLEQPPRGTKTIRVCSGDDPQKPFATLRAWDRPPPVASPVNGWSPREVLTRTPQHLATLVARNNLNTQSWSAPPILWKQQYLIAPTMTGKIYIWDLGRIARDGRVCSFSMHDREKHWKETLCHSKSEPVAEDQSNDRSTMPRSYLNGDTEPDLIVDTLSPELPITIESPVIGAGTSIIQIAVAPTNLLGMAEDSIVALSVCGLVSVIRMETMTAARRLDFVLQTSIVHAWMTDRTGGRCLCVTDDNTILIGYRTGMLEAWKIHPVVNYETNHPISNNHTFEAKVQWRAGFEKGVVIQSILQLNRVPIKHDNIIPVGSAVHVVLTLDNETKTASASLIEVVNTHTISTIWNSREATETAGDSFIVPLDDHCLLPKAGREIVDAHSLPADSGVLNMPFRVHAIGSRGTGCLCSIPTDRSSTSAMLSCAAAVLDGSIVLLSSFLSEHGIGWGVDNKWNQLLLQYPAIGMGIIDFPVGNGSVIPHLAMCLRGSTIYLMPLTENIPETINDHIVPPLYAFSYPHDLDSDLDFQRVQYFSAGNISVESKLSLRKGQIPVVVYCWEGGIIDVYSCKLLPFEDELDMLLLKELVQNGTVETLRDYLQILEIDLSSDSNKLWRTAKGEVSTWSVNGPINLPDLVSDHFVALRSLLFEFVGTGKCDQ